MSTDQRFLMTTAVVGAMAIAVNVLALRLAGWWWLVAIAATGAGLIVVAAVYPLGESDAKRPPSSHGAWGPSDERTCRPRGKVDSTRGRG